MSVMKKSALLLVIPAIFQLTACSETPLGSLKSDKPSLKYTTSFWDSERKAKTALWKQATAICDEKVWKDKPNCGGIRKIEMFANPLPMPKYGSGEGFGEMPALDK